MKNLRFVILFAMLILRGISLQGVENDHTPYRLRVATYNVGHFNQGRLGGFQGEGKMMQAGLNNWRKWIGEQSLDILSTNEWNHFFDKDSTLIAADELLKPFYKNIYWGKEYRWIYNGIATNHQLHNLQQVQWNGDYYALVGDLHLNGKVIKIISTHVPWQKDWHDESLNHLIELLSQYEYFICMGDINAKDDNQKKFLEAGFNMANGGAMGWFTTAQGNAASSGYAGGENMNIDNIITSSNIRIMGVSAPKTGLNDLDHLPVLADLIITW